MKIVRNGAEYELTGMEEYEAYRKCKRDLLIEDIKGRAIEDDIELEDKDIGAIADIVENALDNNDSLWDSYWSSIGYVLENI